MFGTFPGHLFLSEHPLIPQSLNLLSLPIRLSQKVAKDATTIFLGYKIKYLCSELMDPSQPTVGPSPPILVLKTNSSLRLTTIHSSLPLLRLFKRENSGQGGGAHL